MAAMFGTREIWDGRVNLPSLSASNTQAAPAYPHKHNGVCVVAGFGDCLFDDLALVYEKHPHAPLIAVNMAAAYVKAFAVFSMHFNREKLGVWVDRQRSKFGDGFTVHAPGKQSFLEHNQNNYPYVDYWWHETFTRGSSGWGGVKLARLMGFELIIMCGIPLNRRAYANGQTAWYFQSSHSDASRVFRDAIKEDAPNYPMVRAASGWAADLFGQP